MKRTYRCIALTSVERSLLCFILQGHTLEEAAGALGLTVPAAQAALKILEERCGLPNRARLIALAILYVWV